MEDKYTVVKNIGVIDINEDTDLDASSITSTINTDLEVLLDNMVDMLQDKAYAKSTIAQMEYTATQIFAENLYEFLYMYTDYVLQIYNKMVGTDRAFDYLADYLQIVISQLRESEVNINVDKYSIRINADYILKLDMSRLADEGYDLSNIPTFENEDDDE